MTYGVTPDAHARRKTFDFVGQRGRICDGLVRGRRYNRRAEPPVCGISMVRSLLLLTLVLTQLLAGSGASVYLCIDEDGLCCVDGGAESCTCCQQIQAEATDACGRDHGDSQCCRHEESQPSDSNEGGSVTNDACDCTHLPLTMPSDQPASPARKLNASDAGRLLALTALVPSSLDFVLSFDGPQVSESLGALAVPDFTLLMVTAIIIRC